jgi:hypothetical protein
MNMTPLKIVSIAKTCEASPAQWEGVDENSRPVYIRYRWGYLEVCLGAISGDSDSAVFGEEIFGKQIGGKYDSRLSYEQLKVATKGMVELPLKEEI